MVGWAKQSVPTAVWIENTCLTMLCINVGTLRFAHPTVAL